MKKLRETVPYLVHISCSACEWCNLSEGRVHGWGAGPVRHLLLHSLPARSGEQFARKLLLFTLYSVVRGRNHVILAAAPLFFGFFRLQLRHWLRPNIVTFVNFYKIKQIIINIFVLLKKSNWQPKNC